MKTCKKLGIPTVAVYSEADERSLFVKYADEAVLIGPPPPLKSYLCIEAIIEACKKTGATAVHPGYGFLSEKHKFAEALNKNKIEFIGPSPESMRKMSNKLHSKNSAKLANVNIVPGFQGVIENEDHAINIAREIGYPVMIKAEGGGGGRGMRVCYTDQEVHEKYNVCAQEAKSSFDDDRLFIEKFIEEPRHIEFQILGDKHGNVIHLNERECSIQRRNQKIIEEAPSSFLTNEMRENMGEQAVRLAKSTNYFSAGTIEFLVDKQRNFYFLEMNTRLQVEHPITELITGIDLVEQMIRIAAGEKLAHSQNMIPINGWSIEVRVNAENPYINFGIPSIGLIKRYIEPDNVENIRIDSGIVEGSRISIHYDSLIAKLIAHGVDRKSAVNTTRKALDQFVIRGVNQNISLLRDIMDDDDFKAGDINTNYLSTKYPNGFEGKKLIDYQINQIIICAFVSFIQKEMSCYCKTIKMERFINKKYFAEFMTDFFEIVITDVDVELNIITQGVKNVVTITPETQQYVVKNLQINEEKVSFQLVSRRGNSFTIQCFGIEYKIEIFSEKEYSLLKYMPFKIKKEENTIIRSSMNGTLLEIHFKVGDNVEKDAEVAIIEAMKCQNVIVSSLKGTVKKIIGIVGSVINEGDAIMELEK